MQHVSPSPPNPDAPPADGSTALVIDLVRTGRATTRPELTRLSGLGRAVVSGRIDQALNAGIIEEAELGPSTGGRLPRRLRFRSEAGCLLVAVLGTAHVTVAITDLAGAPFAYLEGKLDVAMGADAALTEVCDLLDDLYTQEKLNAPVWGIGLAMPGAVDFRRGQPIGSLMPGWEDFDVRAWFAGRYDAPVWIDNDLNLLVFAQRQTLDPAQRRADRDIVLVKVSYGVGAALISGERIHRGRNGSAGDIGHTAVSSADEVPCRCGKFGCLEAMAGGWALVRDATVAVKEGRSDFLAALQTSNGALTPQDVSEGAGRGDPVCVELVTRSATLVGETLATLVSFFNPAIVYVGGIVPGNGDLFLASLRRAVYEHALPLATRDLRILPASVNQRDALRGAASLVLEQLFDPRRMPLWLERWSPPDAREALYSAG